jgi:glyoxylase-like metal-dependent hydrolase (beta-lactamase superfamily II)
VRVGDLEILPVWDGQMVLTEPPGFPDHDSPEFQPHARYVTNGEYRADLGGFLVRSGERVVLVDAGMGPGPEDGVHRPGGSPEDVARYLDMFRRAGMPESQVVARQENMRREAIYYGSLPENLARLGVRPEEVTDVVISHMHPDHMGWVSEGDRSFFPNARIWAHSADLDFYLGPDAPDETGMRVLLGARPTRQTMAPVQGQVHPWTQDTHVAPGILLRHLPGHTPGNAIAVISSEADTAYILGDSFHCALEIEDDTFHIRGDVDPDRALRQKSVLRAEIESGDIAVASPHFPDLAFGRVVVDSGRRRFSWVA